MGFNELWFHNNFSIYVAESPQTFAVTIISNQTITHRTYLFQIFHCHWFRKVFKNKFSFCIHIHIPIVRKRASRNNNCYSSNTIHKVGHSPNVSYFANNFSLTIDKDSCFELLTINSYAIRERRDMTRLSGIIIKNSITGLIHIIITILISPHIG